MGNPLQHSWGGFLFAQQMYPGEKFIRRNEEEAEAQVATKQRPQHYLVGVFIRFFVLHNSYLSDYFKQLFLYSENITLQQTILNEVCLKRMSNQDTSLHLELSEQLTESYDHVTDKLAHWVDLVVINLPNLLVAILVFTIAYFLSGFIRKYSDRILKKYVDQASLRNLISTLASVVVIAGGLFIALGVLNLDTVLKSMLAGAGVAGLAIGLALQSSLSNTFSGVYLSVQDIINIGDWVETNGYSGTVHEVNLRNTVIREPDNNLVMIPNKMVVENPFKNYGLTDQIRVILTCGVGYDSDLQFVEDVTKKAIKENCHKDADKEIEFHYLEFGDSSINFQVRFWIDAQAKMTMLEARSEAVKVIKKAFDENSIDIPFPIRTINIKNEKNALQETVNAGSSNLED